MAEEKRADDVERILADEKALDARKQAAIDALLKEREDFDAAIRREAREVGLSR